MHARTPSARLAYLVLMTAIGTAACGEVRPGSYRGSVPGPMMVDIPQTAEFQAALAQANLLRTTMATINPSPSVLVKSWTLTSGRDWSYLGHSADWTSTEGGFARTVEASVWPIVASALDASPPGAYPPLLAAGMIEVTAAGLVATDVNHILFAAIQDLSVQPIGPAGPTLAISAGYHVFERACAPDGYATFSEVSLDVISQPIQTGTDDSPGWLSPDDPFVAACGVDASAPIDLGNVVVVPPANQTAAASSFTNFQAFAWAPAADVVYVLAGSTGRPELTQEPSAQLLRLAIGDPAPTVVLSDEIAPPLTVATGGSSLLFWRQGPMHWEYVRQALVPTVTPLQVSLSGSAPAGPTGEPQTALSPDGNLMAAASTTGYLSTGMTFVDLRTGAAVTLALPAAYAPAPRAADLSSPAGFVVIPRAWDPSGHALLVETWNWPDEVAHTFATVSLDVAGALPTVIGAPSALPPALPLGLATRRLAPHPADRAARYFWFASGPGVLLQDAEGARVYDFATQQITPLVEATVVGRADAGLDVVASTGHAFAWAVQCFGFAETACRAQLRRLAIATGGIDVVATADKPRPFAVSPDGRQIVLADDDNMYLKSLVP